MRGGCRVWGRLIRRVFGCVDHLRDRRLPGGQLPRLSPELRAELRVFRGEGARRQHERGYPLHERLGGTSAGDVNPRRLHDAGEDPQGERRHRGAERELLAGPRYRQDLRDGRRKRDRRERGRLHHSRGAHVFRATTFHVDPRSNNIPPGAMDRAGPGGECASRANRAGSRAMKRDGSRGRGDGRHRSSRERGGPSDTRGGMFCPRRSLVRFSILTRFGTRVADLEKKSRAPLETTRGVPRLGGQISTRRRAHTPRANAHAVSSPNSRSAPSRNPEVPRARLA